MNNLKTITINNHKILISELKLIGNVIEKIPFYMTEETCRKYGLDPKDKKEYFTIKLTYQSGYRFYLIFKSMVSALSGRKKIFENLDQHFEEIAESVY